MKHKAIIDIGSLKAKVSIFEVKTKKKIFSDSHLTLMGKGIDETGRVVQESLDMLEGALLKISTALSEKKVKDISIIGTEALRKASNITEVEALIAKYFPKNKLEVIDQHKEAELFFSAISKSFPDQEIAAIDIGGGSVQIIIGRYETEKETVSIRNKYNLKTGTYRFQQQYSPDNTTISPHLPIAEQKIREEFNHINDHSDIMVFGSTCMLDFIQASQIEHRPTDIQLHPMTVSRESLSQLLDEIALLAPNSRDHFYPDGGYFMYGADYLLINLLAAIDRLQPTTIYPTNLNSSYAFIE